MDFFKCGRSPVNAVKIPRYAGFSFLALRECLTCIANAEGFTTIKKSNQLKNHWNDPRFWTPIHTNYICKSMILNDSYLVKPSKHKSRVFLSRHLCRPLETILHLKRQKKCSTSQKSSRSHLGLKSYHKSNKTPKIPIQAFEPQLLTKVNQNANIPLFHNLVPQNSEDS